MKAILQKIVRARPAPSVRDEAARKRIVEAILRDEGLPKRARTRAVSRIWEEALRGESR